MKDRAEKNLVRFLGKPPAAAERLRIETRAMGGSSVLLELTKAETAEQSADQLKEIVLTACESFSENANRDALFFGAWLAAGDRVVASLQWKGGPETGQPTWDGSIESLIGHLHAQLAAKDKAFLELLRIQSETFTAALKPYQERTAQLERERQRTERMREDLIKLQAELTAGVPLLESGSGEPSPNRERLEQYALEFLKAAFYHHGIPFPSNPNQRG